MLIECFELEHGSIAYINKHQLHGHFRFDWWWPSGGLYILGCERNDRCCWRLVSFPTEFTGSFFAYASRTLRTEFTEKTTLWRPVDDHLQLRKAAPKLPPLVLGLSRILTTKQALKRETKHVDWGDHFLWLKWTKSPLIWIHVLTLLKKVEFLIEWNYKRIWVNFRSMHSCFALGIIIIDHWRLHHMKKKSFLWIYLNWAIGQRHEDPYRTRITTIPYTSVANVPEELIRTHWHCRAD